MNKSEFNKLLFSFFDDWKNHSRKFMLNKSQLIFDFSTSSLGVYLNYKPLHKDEFTKFLNDNENFRFCSLPDGKNDFFSNYLSYMEVHNDKRRVIYGYLLTFFYPNVVIEQQKELSFIKSFVNELTNHMNVPFVVYETIRNHITQVKVLIIDRLYLKNVKYKVYTSNKYIDIRTGRFAAKDCPNEYKSLKCKMGDYVLDKNGEKIRTGAVFSNSLRHFSYAKEKRSGKNLFLNFVYKLKLTYLNALQRVTVGMGARKGIRFKKIKVKYSYHRYTKRRISAFNYAIQTVEYLLNYCIQGLEKSNRIHYNPKNWKNDIKITSEPYKKLISLGAKMKKWFSSGFFVSLEGEKIAFSPFRGRCDLLEQNILKLFSIFHYELMDIYSAL